MNRAELEHVIRASGGISGDHETVAQRVSGRPLAADRLARLQERLRRLRGDSL
jgi:hypothetical protein